MKLGANQKKIILVLLGTAALMCSHSPKQSYYAIRLVGKEWRKINRQNLSRSLKMLKDKKLIQWKKEGKYFAPVLTRLGRRQAEMYRMNEMKIPKTKVWDGKWRMVLFDVPEKEKPIRDYFRQQLKRLRFYELQKSVFVTPYPCRKQMVDISENYHRGQAIRFIEALYVDNEKELKKHFDLR